MSSQNHLLLSPLMLPSAFFRKQRASLQTFGHFMVGWAKMESGPKNSQFRFNGLNIFSFRTNVIKILFISQACQNGLFLLSLKSLKEGIYVCKFLEKSHFTKCAKWHANENFWRILNILQVMKQSEANSMFSTTSLEWIE